MNNIVSYLLRFSADSDFSIKDKFPSKGKQIWMIIPPGTGVPCFPVILTCFWRAAFQLAQHLPPPGAVGPWLLGATTSLLTKESAGGGMYENSQSPMGGGWRSSSPTSREWNRVRTPNWLAFAEILRLHFCPFGEKFCQIFLKKFFCSILRHFGQIFYESFLEGIFRVFKFNLKNIACPSPLPPLPVFLSDSTPCQTVACFRTVRLQQAFYRSAPPPSVQSWGLLVHINVRLKNKQFKIKVFFCVIF